MNEPLIGAARRVLVVEDEPSIADTLIYALRTEGFAPVHCGTGAAATAELAREAVACVILDVGLPDGNGFDWCRELRRSSAVPVLFLTARNDEIDRVVGLEIGGDDYVTKPFSPREVTARVKAILRRGPLVRMPTEGAAGGTGAGAVTPERRAEGTAAGGEPRLQIDGERCEASYAGRVLVLTRYEFRLLAVLAARPGRVFSRDRLMESAWEDPGASLDRTVDAHIKTLRAKLREIAAEGNPIRTHRGLGYSWNPSA